MEEAKEALGHKQFKRAIRLFSSALKEDPYNIGAYYGLAQAYYLINRLSDAENVTIKAIEIDPTSFDLYGLLFWIKYKQEANKNELYQIAEKAYTIAPDDPATLNNFGVANWKIGNNDAAIRLLEKAIQIDPSDHRLHSTLGSIFFQLKMKDLAFREAGNSYRLHPSIQTGYRLFIFFINLDRPFSKIAKIFYWILLFVVPYIIIFAMFIWKNPWLAVFPVAILLFELISGIKFLRRKAMFKGIVHIVFSLTFLAFYISLAINMARQ